MNTHSMVAIQFMAPIPLLGPVEPRKKARPDFPWYQLFNKDPYNGLVQYPPSWVVWSPYTLNNQLPFFLILF